jgi:putative transposase
MQGKTPGNDTRLRPGNHCVFRLWYHLVLVTKYRHKAITADMAARIDQIARAIVEKHGGRMAEVNGETDHRHFLLDLPPSAQPSRLVCSIKTATSRIVRKEYASHVRSFYSKPVFWSRSYCLLSAGGAPSAVIRRYIENKDLHKN